MRRTFFGVQVLRGLAATLVVFFHVGLGLRALDLLPGNRPVPSGQPCFQHSPVPFFGNGGVDLFFLISGFVIVWTTQDSWDRPGAWRRFLDKRARRIFPLYWGLTTAKLVLLLLAPALFAGSALLPWHAVASYLLIPAWNAEGGVQPLISAGWTLCYEMFFYYIVALCLAARRPPLTAAPGLVALGVLGCFRTPAWTAGPLGALTVLIDPLLLEFVGGMVLADLARRGRVRGGMAPMLGLFALGAAAMAASDLQPVPLEYQARVLVWGVPAAAMVYATIALEGRLDFRRWRLPLLLGDASYSIYLSHVVVLQPLIHHVRRWHLSAVGEGAAYAGIVIAGLAFGVAVWWGVERRLGLRPKPRPGALPLDPAGDSSPDPIFGPG